MESFSEISYYGVEGYEGRYMGYNENRVFIYQTLLGLCVKRNK